MGDLDNEASSLQFVLVVNEFPYMFLDDLLRIPSKREISVLTFS